VGVHYVNIIVTYVARKRANLEYECYVIAGWNTTYFASGKSNAFHQLIFPRQEVDIVEFKLVKIVICQAFR
jgi:hypothetical protein